MNFFLILVLFCLGGCATKYVIPGNRFLTPETQGQAFRGQVELLQTNANQLTIDVTKDTVDEGVIYNDLSRMGFLLSHSFFEQFDVIWSHTGSANSMLGGKFQFYGASRTANGLEHKLAIAAMVGANEHETPDEAVEFKLGGQEFLIIYGYRFSEIVLAYGSFSHATYDFEGTISAPGTGIDGAKPKLKTKVNSLSAGVELTLNAFFGKLEGTYQQLQTSDTKEKLRLAVGYSIGLNW
ncbi:MAG TPA: hypothetical protein VNJ01_04235 [Bacteriovoracaceae bacterium]|nr:hypothetical protein [Bacteriovoracaceae bacterium]